MVTRAEHERAEPRLVVVMPSYNRWHEARISLDHLMKSEYRNFEVVLVEDGCTDGTAEKCRAEFPEVKLLHGDGNLWWSGAINMGIEYALKQGADAVVWINDDNRVEPETLGSLVESFRRQGERSVICSRIKLIGEDAREWRGDPPPWHEAAKSWTAPDISGVEDLQIVHPPGGQGVLIPAACFREIGLADKRNFPMHWADHNFHYRAMKAGYKYFISTKAIVWNKPNERRGAEKDIFSLRGAWWLLLSRRSPTNMLTLRRHFKLMLPPREYRKTFYPMLWRHVKWLSYEWLIRNPALHKPIRAVKRRLFPGNANGAETLHRS